MPDQPGVADLVVDAAGLPGARGRRVQRAHQPGARAGPAPATPCRPAPARTPAVPSSTGPADQAGHDTAARRAGRGRSGSAGRRRAPRPDDRDEHRGRPATRTPAGRWSPHGPTMAPRSSRRRPGPGRSRRCRSARDPSGRRPPGRRRSSSEVELLVVEQLGLGRRPAPAGRARHRGARGPRGARPRCARPTPRPAAERARPERRSAAGAGHAAHGDIRLASGLVSSASRRWSRCGPSRSMRIFSTPPCPSANTNCRGRVVGPVVVPRPRGQRAQHLLVADPGGHPQQPQRLGLRLLVVGPADEHRVDQRREPGHPQQVAGQLGGEQRAHVELAGVAGQPVDQHLARRAPGTGSASRRARRPCAGCGRPRRWCAGSASWPG